MLSRSRAGVDELDDRGAQYTRFLKRSFRDVEKVPWCAKDVAGPHSSMDSPNGGLGRDPKLSSISNNSGDAALQSMYHSNFLRAVRRIRVAHPTEQPTTLSRDSTLQHGGARSGAVAPVKPGGTGSSHRILDVKAFGPMIDGHGQSEPVGFAVLQRGGDGSVCCFLQRMEPTNDATDFPSLSPNPDALSTTSDGYSGPVHGPFRRYTRHIVQLPPAYTSATRVALEYAGGGIVIAVALSGTSGRIDFVDLLAEVPAFERVRMDDWSDVVSTRATGFRPNLVVLSCLGKRSHFMVTFERIIVTPRSSAPPPPPHPHGPSSRFAVSVTKHAFVNQTNEVPCHLAISPTAALVFPTIKQDRKWALLRVRSDDVGGESKTEQFKNVDLKAKVTFVGLFNTATSESPTILIGTEEGNVAVLPYPLPSHESGALDVRFTSVFDAGDVQQRSIQSVKQTSLQTMFVVTSHTSAALISVDDQAQAVVSVVSRKISASPIPVSDFGVLHVHLPRQLSANPNFVLLSADGNGFAVQMHTFLQLQTLAGSAPLAPGGGAAGGGLSPPISTRDLGGTQQGQQQQAAAAAPSSGGTTAASNAKTSPQMQPLPATGGAGPSKTAGPSLGFFGKLKAKLTSKFGKAGGSVGADQFCAKVNAEPIAVFCDGYGRKSLTSVSKQHRIIPLDPRVHGFLVWLRLHNQEDDLLLLSDHVIPQGLLSLRPED